MIWIIRTAYFHFFFQRESRITECRKILERRLGSSKVVQSTVSVDIHSSGIARTDMTSLPSTTNNNTSIAGLAEESSTLEADKIHDLLSTEVVESAIPKDANQNEQTLNEPNILLIGSTSTVLIEYEMNNADAGELL